jgi:mono/diheme cytochrome c family protein
MQALCHRVPNVLLGAPTSWAPDSSSGDGFVKTTKRCGGLFSVAGFTLAVFLAGGCGNKEGENPGEPPAGTSSAGANATTQGAPAASGGDGAAIYAANNCANCHQMDGKGGKGGPDLTKVGAEAEHTKDWIAAHIEDPQQHNPMSKMPKFAEKIAEADLNSLAEWLAAKK